MQVAGMNGADNHISLPLLCILGATGMSVLFGLLGLDPRTNTLAWFVGFSLGGFVWAKIVDWRDRRRDDWFEAQPPQEPPMPRGENVFALSRVAR